MLSNYPLAYVFKDCFFGMEWQLYQIIILKLWGPYNLIAMWLCSLLNPYVTT